MNPDQTQPAEPHEKEPRENVQRVSRRDALKVGALAGAGLAGAGTALFPRRTAASALQSKDGAADETKNMHVSLAAYSMREALESREMTMFDFVDWCAEMGLAGAELTSYFFQEGFDANYLHRLRGAAFRHGVTVSGTAIGNNFCLPPGPEKQEEIAQVKQWIDHAAELFAPHIRIFAGTLPEEASPEEGIDWVAGGIEQVLGHAEERGVVLGLENHGTFTGEIDTHLAICEKIGENPWFGINLDTGNYRSNAYESLAKAAPQAVNVQLKANIRGEDGTEEPVDIDRIRQILIEADYKGWIVLEYEEENPREAIPPYVERLQEVYS